MASNLQQFPFLILTLVLILSLDSQHSANSLTFSSRTALLSREQRTVRNSDAVIYQPERSRLFPVKLYLKGLLLYVKKALLRIRSTYRFLKPEMKMASCFTEYYHINPFRLRRRKRSVNYSTDGKIATHLLKISNSLSDIQQAITEILKQFNTSTDSSHKEHEQITGLQSNTTGTSIQKIVVQNNNITKRVDTPVKTKKKEKDNSSDDVYDMLDDIVTSMFVSVFGQIPDDLLDLVVEAQPLSLWKYIKVNVKRVVTNKLMICSGQYLGKRIWGWAESP